MNKITKKRLYVSPSAEVTYITMEMDIAVSSVVINTGGPGNEPRIEEWENTDGKYKNFDL